MSYMMNVPVSMNVNMGVMNIQGFAAAPVPQAATAASPMQIFQASHLQQQQQLLLMQQKVAAQEAQVTMLARQVAQQQQMAPQVQVIPQQAMFSQTQAPQAVGMNVIPAPVPQQVAVQAPRYVAQPQVQAAPVAQQKPERKQRAQTAQGVSNNKRRLQARNAHPQLDVLSDGSDHSVGHSTSSGSAPTTPPEVPAPALACRGHKFGDSDEDFAIEPPMAGAVAPLSVDEPRALVQTERVAKAEKKEKANKRKEKRAKQAAKRAMPVWSMYEDDDDLIVPVHMAEPQPLSKMQRVAVLRAVIGGVVAAAATAAAEKAQALDASEPELDIADITRLLQSLAIAPTPAADEPKEVAPLVPSALKGSSPTTPKKVRFALD